MEKPPYPDELVYSLFCRYRDQERIRPRDLIKIFGITPGLKTFLFPLALEKLSSKLHPDWELTSDRLFENHTVVRYYGGFLSRERLGQLKTVAIRGGTSLNMTLGYKYYPVPLRFCPGCAREDKEPYFRAAHHIIGSPACAKHGLLLENLSFQGPPFEFLSLKNFDRPIETPDRPAHEVLITLARDIEYCASQWRSGGGVEAMKAIIGKLKAIRRNSLQLLWREEKVLSSYTAPVQGFLPSLERRPIGVYKLLQGNFESLGQPYYILLLLRAYGLAPEEVLSLKLEKPIFKSWCINPICRNFQKLTPVRIEVDETDWNDSFLIRCKTCGLAYSRRKYQLQGKRPPQFPVIHDFGKEWTKKFRKLWLDPKTSLNSLSKQLGFGPESRVYFRAALINGLPLDRNGASISKFSYGRFKKAQAARDARIEKHRKIIRGLKKRIPNLTPTQVSKLAPKTWEFSVYRDYLWWKEFFDLKDTRNLIRHP